MLEGLVSVPVLTSPWARERLLAGRASRVDVGYGCAMVRVDQDPLEQVPKQLALRLAVVWVVLPLFFLAVGGSFAWWEAWLYCGVLIVPMTIFGLWMARHDLAFLARRFKMREKEQSQRTIQLWGSVPFVGAVLVPGLDERFGWSDVPWPVVIAGALFSLLGYLFILRVFWVNRWAGRTVETSANQELITDGPYRFVRHPMYVGVIVWLFATPVALGSWWGLIPVGLVVPGLVARIVDEEKVLVRDLPGYENYQKCVRYRLLPGIW